MSVKILAIETSTMLGGVALMDGDEGLIAEVRFNLKAAHSERLMAGVDYVLSRSSLGLREMDAIAVAIGPGSFTGLRIGLGTAKGLAFATGLPVVAVPTLEAFAWSIPYPPHPVCPMLDARKKEVYAGLFAREGEEMRRLMPEMAVRAATLAEALGAYEAVLFVGEGAVLYRDELRAALGKKAVFAPRHLMVTSPAAVAYAGLMLHRKGEYADPAGLCPFYIRKSEAEVRMQ